MTHCLRVVKRALYYLQEIKNIAAVSAVECVRWKDLVGDVLEVSHITRSVVLNVGCKIFIVLVLSK